MTDWSADLYLRFDAERTRAALDLLAHVAIEAAEHVVDIGCGPGNSTALLAQRWPQARVEGFDNSPAMLSAARERLPGVHFFEANAATWRPEGSESLLFANAVFQWVPDHLDVLEALLDGLSSRSVLAVQMPDNLGEPSHRLMRAVALDGAWRTKLAEAELERERLPSAEAYFDRLRPASATIDVWRTTYYHQLDSIGALVDWLRGTGLRPYLPRLDEAEQAEFLRQFEERLEEAYPVREDGRVLLPFPRLFIVATRG